MRQHAERPTDAGRRRWAPGGPVGHDRRRGEDVCGAVDREAEGHQDECEHVARVERVRRVACAGTQQRVGQSALGVD